MLYAIVALLAVIVDQWVKYWVAGNIPLESTVNELIPGVISVVNVHNSGAAFGFLNGGGARIPFIIICGVFTVAIIIALATNFISNPLGRWSAVFVMAGGIGNCIDRILYGYVQDMFMFEFAPNFPTTTSGIFRLLTAAVFSQPLIVGPSTIPSQRWLIASSSRCFSRSGSSLVSHITGTSPFSNRTFSIASHTRV